MFEQQKAQELAEGQFSLNKILIDEIKDLDFNEVLDENENFYIQPTIVIERSGQMIAVYGIYNKNTGIRESESRQFGGAQEWMRVLNNSAMGVQEDLPGLVSDETTH